MTTCANDICERVLEYWGRTGQLLPEVTGLEAGEIREIIDGIPNENNDLILVLKAWAH